MTNKFLKSISEKQFKEDLKASVIFSQTLGLIIILLSGYKFLVSSSVKSSGSIKCLITILPLLNIDFVQLLQK